MESFGRSNSLNNQGGGTQNQQILSVPLSVPDVKALVVEYQITTADGQDLPLIFKIAQLLYDKL